MEQSVTTPTGEQKKRDITASVLKRVELFHKSGELRLPKDYSAENALKSAYIVLSDPKNKVDVLEKCTSESIANALLKMVVWGLSPLKKQCDFVPYGDKLECIPEYTGNIAMAKRYGGLQWIKANVVYKGDKFHFGINPHSGAKVIREHEQSLSSLGSKDIVGVYAVYALADGRQDIEIMSMEQVRDAWAQSANKGLSPAHQKFPDQMAMKTVINRACKLLIRSSDDSVLYDEAEGDVDVVDVSSEEVRTRQAVEPVSFELPSPEPLPVIEARAEAVPVEAVADEEGELELGF